MCGFIDRRSPDRLKAALSENPDIDRLVMQYVPGGYDGIKPVFEIAQMMQKRDMAVHVPKNGLIASFGTTVFVAGTKRTVDNSGKVGVHAWTNRYQTVDPTSHRNAKAHKVLIGYYTSLGIPEDFYWFTVKAAPFESMYYMSRRELKRFKIVTQ